MAEGESTELDLRGYARLLRRRWWVVVLLPLLTAGVAYVAAESKTPLYKSSAELLIARTQAETLFDPLGAGAVGSDRVLANQVRIMKSQQVADLARRKLPSVGKVSASHSTTEDVITISAVDTDPRRARATVTAYARAYLQFRTESLNQQSTVAQREIERQLAEVQRQLEVLDAAVRAAPIRDRAVVETGQATQRTTLAGEKTDLLGQLNQLQAAINVNQGGAQLLAPATLPRAPFEPNPERSGLLGLVVGLMLAVGMAFLLDFLDDRIRGSEDLVRVTTDIPVLGHIPVVGSWKKQRRILVSLDDPSSGAAEAYRSLRTSVQFLGLDTPVRTLQFTSASAAEGKSTTAANLAVALARAGQRVILVDCDLRRPMIHEYFGLDPTVGFTSVLLGDAPLSAAFHRVPGIERLRILAAGPVPPNPSELLSTHRMVDLLTTLQADSDIVLLDSPPVLPVSDAAVLSARVDGVLMVVKAGSTHRKQLGRALELLSQVDASVVGVALNGVSKGGAYAYGYGYGYQGKAGGYGARSPVAGKIRNAKKPEKALEAPAVGDPASRTSA